MYQNIPDSIKRKLDTAPKKPGVYMFRDDKGEVIYVGKAVNLPSRTKSYFANYKRLDPRIQAMVENARDLEYLTVDNEIEAFLLESNLIKKYMPHYNRAGKDDKNYLWIEIQSQLDFPIVRTVREKKLKKADYFGPFPNVGAVRRMLKQLRKVFKYHSTSRVIEERVDKDDNKYIYTSDNTPCFHYHLGLCSGACMGIIPKEEYRKQINDLKRFLRSDHKELKADYKKQMEQFSQDKDYEKAADMRDKLRDLELLTKFTLIDETVDDMTLRQKQLDYNRQGIVELVDRLQIDGLKVSEADSKKFRMECYDISNIQGTNAVSAMVVSIGGKLEKKHYRKFKIKLKNTPDDFAMLQETLQRRLKYLVDDKKQDESFSQKPDLIIIDGGKGQVSSVLKIMQKYETKYGLYIPIIGLAKKREEIFVPKQVGKDVEFRLVKLSKRAPGLRVVTMLRDEAHRFGIGYHRLLRSKEMIYSELDLIPGVGEVTKKNLIQAFGSVQGIRKAKLEDIETVVRNKNTAFKIKKILV